MADPVLRAFVNERPVTVPRGARVRDAVAALDLRLADQVQAGEAYVTDARGIQVTADDPVGEAGAVYRVVVSARPGGAALSKDVLRRWPKVELHVHLDGCLRPATMIELARMQGVKLPADTPDELAKKLSVKGARNLEEYLVSYGTTLSVMQTPEALERVAYEFVQDVAAENVRYVEVRYSPLLHRPALTMMEAIEAHGRDRNQGGRDRVRDPHASGSRVPRAGPGGGGVPERGRGGVRSGRRGTGLPGA
jgi:hypothetical protein